MLRDLLVHVEGGECGRQRVNLAVDLAERSGARLSGLHVVPPVEIAPLYKPSQIDAALARRSSALAADARDARQVFTDVAIERVAGACWLETEGDMVGSVSQWARFADLVILGQGEWQEPPQRHPLPMAHQVALRCGRPVLVVPSGVQSAAFAKVAVAWDGSREAVRAIHDALPLLKAALTVHLITMIKRTDTGLDADVDDLLAHLSNHDIAVEADVQRVEAAEEHATLQRHINQGAYDLLVMGGYSHPMWMEFIFGGATRSALLSSDIPVLVSH
jgi:nucleotide-binding universal stress UspA family protein